MKNFITIFLLFCTLNILAQGEANFWFFGRNAGLNFNSGAPVALTNGKLNTIEGCASISNKDGQLLFYTDGTRIYDNTHNQMPNGFGLNGNPSSSQSAIIVPNPIDENIYYVFTVEDQNGEGRGLQYSTVDLSLNDVVSKNNPLVNETAEKITAVKSADCSSYWVITYKLGRFYVFMVDGNGVSNTPINGNNGFYFNSDGRGYLKVSPDGTKIAIAHQGDAKLLIYDFDDRNGKISNEIEIPLLYPNNKPYGIEFSPSGKRLYCTASNDFWNQDYQIWNTPSNHTSSLYQINLESTDITNASARTILDNRNLYRGALQLAPDGKIYRALSITYNIGSSKLGVINSPEELGALCNYKPDAIDLGSGRAMQGLPPFVASLLLPLEITSVENNNKIITNQKVKLCVGSNYSFNTEFIPGNPDYSWTHQNIERNDTPTLTLTNIQTTDAGIYKLEVNLIDDCGFPIIYEGSFEVEVFYPPVISNTFIYDQCDIDDDSTDGITLFNLTTKIEEITQNDPNLEVFFFLTQADLDTNNAITQIDSYRSANNPNLLVKLVNNQSGCFTTGKMEMNVYPTSLDSYDNYYECENDISLNNDLKSIGSGNAKFDFEIKRQEILALFSNPSIEVEFYENTNDAQLQINSLQGNIDFSSKEIIVRISNKLSKNCISVGKFDLIVNPIPVPNGSDEEIILCVSNPRDNPQLSTTYLDGNTLDPNDTYQWYFNNNSISGATNSFYEANAEGTYKVEVLHLSENDLTNPADDSYCKGFNSFIVVESNPPAIQINDITVEDDSNNNTITISTNNLGLGDYEYSLIDINGTIEYNYQNEPFFNNVPPGIHTVYIQDKNNCGIAPIEVSIIGYPKFFTPNNDGYNDTWNVLGVNENFYQQKTVYIFDRFGKLITEIGLYSEGWNGTFNGNFLPATDYWFSVELVDLNGNVRVKKGHFSLIRK